MKDARRLKPEAQAKGIAQQFGAQSANRYSEFLRLRFRL
jgi:hypothetical protein